jgi:hypothetical protein
LNLKNFKKTLWAALRFDGYPFFVGAGFTVCPATKSAKHRNFTIDRIDFERQLFENLSKATQQDAFVLV